MLEPQGLEPQGLAQEPQGLAQEPQVLAQAQEPEPQVRAQGREYRQPAIPEVVAEQAQGPPNRP